MPTIASIHDKFLRAILSDKEIAIDYFKVCLPGNIADLLDLYTLTQLPDTYISKELRKTASDIVYSCRLKDNKQEFRISLLLEHKSTPEKFTPVQILSYIASGHSKPIAKDKTVSPIIPVLLYHGKERWQYRTLITLFKSIDQELRQFIPDYEYIYHDLGEIPDEQIEALENRFLQASLLALKYSQLKKELRSLIPTILSLAMEIQENLRSNLFVYTFGVSGRWDYRSFGRCTCKHKTYCDEHAGYFCRKRKEDRTGRRTGQGASGKNRKVRPQYATRGIYDGVYLQGA